MTRKNTACGLSEAGTGPIHYMGHRQRLKMRLRKSGADTLQDYELLELVLFSAIPRKDTKPLAKELLGKFGSFAEVINAPDNRLREIKGVGDAVITEFRLIAASASRLVGADIKKKDIFDTWDRLIDYCRQEMAFETREQFRIIFLDKRNQLIADEIQSRGTVDHTPVYIREVAKRALELSATALVLVHNHPSGDPAPSRADIDMTRKIKTIAEGLGIVVHDHIIIGKNGHSSFRKLGLL